MKADPSARSDYAAPFALMLGAALLMGLLWLMIDSNRFHVVQPARAAPSSQPASPAPGK